MHPLRTSEAVIVGSFPHGESNRVLKVFTERFGLLYVHAQGVRELKNRNRYALVTGAPVLVTLVKGREVWRLTGAGAGTWQVPPSAVWRRVIDVSTRYLPHEVCHDELFGLLRAVAQALTATDPRDHKEIELLAVLRILSKLGYVGVHGVADGLTSEVTNFDTSSLDAVRVHRTALIQVVNNALKAVGTG